MDRSREIVRTVTDVSSLGGDCYHTIVSSDHPSLPNRSRSQLDARGLPIFTKTYQNDHHHRRHSTLDPHLDPTSFSRSSTSTGYSGDMPPPPPPPSAAYQQSRGSTVRSIRAQAIRRGLDLDSSLGNMSIALSSVSSGRSGYISRTGSSLNGSCKNSAVRRSTIDPRSLDLDSTSGGSGASRSGSGKSFALDKTPIGLADPPSLDSTFSPGFESTPRSQYEARVGYHRRKGSTLTPSARSSGSEQDRSHPALGYSTPAMAVIPEEVGPRLTHLDHWRWTTARANRVDSEDDELPSRIAHALKIYDEDAPSISGANASSVLIDEDDETITITPKPSKQRPGVPKRFRPRALGTPNKGTPGPDPLANWDTPQLADVPRRMARRQRAA
jgi:hypothetical protein